MRALVASALVLAFALPGATAQVGSGGTLTNPILCGDPPHPCAYHEAYLVAGRAVDADGNPLGRGEVVVRLESPGVVAAPVAAGTDCFGTFITYFELARVNPQGKISVAARDANGREGPRVEHALDPFFRRSDFNVTLPGSWSGGCPEQTGLWPQRVSVTGRILDRTDPYTVGADSFDARPIRGNVRALYWIAPDHYECPPAREEGLCDPLPVDERGDFRYSWVFDAAQEPVGHVEIYRGENETFQSWNFTIDPTFRYALAYVETTGRGPPPIATNGSPGMGLVALALAALAGALLARRRG